MKARITSLLLLHVVALTGCAETALSCGPGEVEDEDGTCVADPFDAGPNNPDTGVDAGPRCSPACDDGQHCVEVEPGTLACVECREDGDCDSGRCSADHRCVECETHGDCPATAGQCNDAGTCVACELPLHCAGRTDGRTICGESGACVECTAEDASPCGGNACRPDGTCSEFGTDQAACLPCDTDANCADGLICVEMSFGDPPTVVGTFCQWRRTATGGGAPNGTCGLTSQPYAQTLPDVTSVDGVEADICTLRTTTCTALLQHARPAEGCDAVNDDDACGVEGLRDGRCRLNGADDPLCTYPCLGTEDCWAGSTCPSAGDRVCSI